MYMCIFDSKKECPVRTEYKLKPESLVPFCKLCVTLELSRSVKSVIPQEGLISVSSENRHWYEFMKEKGYSGSIQDFVNECIAGFFKNQGLAMATILEREEKKEHGKRLGSCLF